MGMTAFDQAWAVVKMARHIVDDFVEIWDNPEVYANSFNEKRHRKAEPFPKGYEHLPKFYEREQPMPEDFGWSNTHGRNDEDEWVEKPREKWRSFRAGYIDESLKNLRGDGNVYGHGLFADAELPEGRDKPLTWEEMQDIHRQYYDDDYNHEIFYPWGGGAGGTTNAKIMLTPNEFLQLAYKGMNEDKAAAMAEQWRKNGGRTPIGMPLLDAQLTNPENRIYPQKGRGWDNEGKKYVDKPEETILPLQGGQNFTITGHEGRHRMAALRSMGYGDKPLPVQFGLKDNSKHAFGIDPSGRHHTLEQALSQTPSILTSQRETGEKVIYNRQPNTTYGVGEIERL